MLGSYNRGPMPDVTEQELPPVVRFADYALDRERGVLFHKGAALKLQPQPLRALTFLILCAPGIVSRETLAAHIWGDGVHVDVEASLNYCIRQIRQVLDDRPANPKFLETLPRQGYRFIGVIEKKTVAPAGEIEPLQTSDGARAMVELPRTNPQAQSTADRVKPAVKAALVFWLASCLGVAGWLSLRHHSNVIVEPKIRSLAVLPLRNLSGDPAQDYLADGMTEALISRLANIHTLHVTSHTSAMRFKDSHLSMPEIARTLAVDAVVEGSVIKQGDRIRVTAQLIRGSNDEHFWSETYDREMRDALTLESELALAISDKVAITITGEEHQRLSAARSVAPEVYESYLRGRFVLEQRNRTGAEQSIPYFEGALKHDPDFAPAYVGLAGAYNQLGTIYAGGLPATNRTKLLTSVRKALELDPDVVQAHVLLADVLREEWHWNEAETENRRALQLNPNDPEANAGMALWLMCQGRTDEAVSLIRHARALDPVAISGADVAFILFHSRKFDDAIREARSTLAVRPQDGQTLLHLGFSLTAANRPAEAIPVLEKLISLSSGSPAATGVLVRAYAHAGRRHDALKLLEELKRRRKAGYIPAGAFVNAYLGLDDKEQAFYWLEEAYKEQSNILQFLKTHPYFDPIRGDPRFADLVRRVGLD